MENDHNKDSRASSSFGSLTKKVWMSGAAPKEGAILDLAASSLSLAQPLHCRVNMQVPLNPWETSDHKVRISTGVKPGSDRTTKSLVSSQVSAEVMSMQGPDRLLWAHTWKAQGKTEAKGKVVGGKASFSAQVDVGEGGKRDSSMLNIKGASMNAKGDWEALRLRWGATTSSMSTKTNLSLERGLPWNWTCALGGGFSGKRSGKSSKVALGVDYAGLDVFSKEIDWSPFLETSLYWSYSSKSFDALRWLSGDVGRRGRREREEKEEKSEIQRMLWKGARDDAKKALKKHIVELENIPRDESFRASLTKPSKLPKLSRSSSSNTQSAKFVAETGLSAKLDPYTPSSSTFTLLAALTPLPNIGVSAKVETKPAHEIRTKILSAVQLAVQATVAPLVVAAARADLVAGSAEFALRAMYKGPALKLSAIVGASTSLPPNNPKQHIGAKFTIHRGN